MSKITSMFSQYEILRLISKYLSTLDLIHLATINSKFYVLIRKDESLWNLLMREALCDGNGLEIRQNFARFYALAEPDDFMSAGRRKPRHDEEIEVRVWNLKCDAASGLPCIKCGVNVCEECRYMPRVSDLAGRKAFRRPHLIWEWESHNVVCYCKTCDAEVDRNLPFFLDEFCNCDQYKRWICLPCKEKEYREDEEYYSKHTKTKRRRSSFSAAADGGMWLEDGEHMRAFWCPCGIRDHKDGNVRCAWCKRRHNLETWFDEDSLYIPFFDDDPFYV